MIMSAVITIVTIGIFGGIYAMSSWISKIYKQNIYDMIKELKLISINDSIKCKF